MEYENRQLLLRVDYVSMAFKAVSVLRDIFFEIYDTFQAGSPVPRGQVVAVLGRSGAGKTQLFRCIAGLQVPTNGAVFLDDQAEPVFEGQVGVVAQDYPLIETRTVMGNLVRAFLVSHKRTGFLGRVSRAFQLSWGREKSKRTGFGHVVGFFVALSGSFHGFVGDEEAESLAMGYLDRFGLTSLVDHYPSKISGGQRQRIAIIQQMMCSKHFLLMDEPFSGLDIVAKNAARDLVIEMAAQDELNTIILTTHDVRTACAAADRVIVIGRDRDDKGEFIPGSRIMADFDLKALDLCWIPGITKTPKFLALVEEIEGMLENI